MVLAKNLKPKRTLKLKSESESKKNYKKIALYVVIFLVVVLGAYGLFNVFRIAPKSEDKKEIKLETGDRPLPEEVKIWVNARGGLNMRQEPDAKSTILKTIPNETELVASELSGDWYRVSFEGKTGWVHKDFIRTFKNKEGFEEVLDWRRHQSATFGYSVQYPNDWVFRDYGPNEAANLLAYIGFGKQLANTIDPQNTPPIVIKITSDSREKVEELYRKKKDFKSEPLTIAGLAGSRYIFTASSGVQMTAYVVSSGGRTFILEESGGYRTELSKMASSLVF